MPSSQRPGIEIIEDDMALDAWWESYQRDVASQQAKQKLQSRVRGLEPGKQLVSPHEAMDHVPYWDPAAG